MRRLVEAGTKIVQLGYTEEGEVDDAVDQAQAEVYAVTERRESDDYVQLSQLLPDAYDEIEKISAGVVGEGVKTGFKDLDALTNGFHPGNMMVQQAINRKQLFMNSRGVISVLVVTRVCWLSGRGIR